MADVDVSQLRALVADLGKAGAKTALMASQAVRKAAADVEARAKATAPVDTGALRNSIGTSMNGPLAAEIGPTVHYGVYVEKGTYKMPAQPYMDPALTAVEPGFVAAMGQLGGDIL